MDTPIETIEYRGFNINIYPDFDPMDPRSEFDNFGIMICKHPNYILGDKQDMIAEEIIALTERNDVEYFWLFLLDHSGLWMKTGTFACDAAGWDTSRVGIIYCTHEQIIKEYDELSDETIHKAKQLMQGEVETYSQYLSGEVYGYQIEPTDTNKSIECDDGCWGFFGYEWDRNGLMEYAKNSIDWAIKDYKKGVIENHKRKQEINTFMKSAWAL